MRSSDRAQRSMSTISIPTPRIMRSSACGQRYPRLRDAGNGDLGLAADQRGANRLRCGGGALRRQMVVIVKVAETLVQDRPQVEVLQAKLLGDGNHPRIDLAEETVDHLETE